MSFEWFIAKRFIRTHRQSGFLSFIATFAVLGVTLGTAALIITLSILDGFEREIKDKVIGFTSHIQVQGFQNITLHDERSAIETVRRSVPNVAAITPYVAREGMIRSRDAVDGILLKGIDLASDISAARRSLVEGSYLSGRDSSQAELVIGRRLALRLSAAVGDRLTVYGLPGAGREAMQPRAMQFRLVGIYESGMAEYDDVYAYTTLASAQRLFEMAGGVSGYDLLVHDVGAADETARKVQELLGYPHYARTVFQLYRNLFAWVELQKTPSPILLGLIMIVATVNIIGTLLMFVLEKTKEIGIMKSLGAGPKAIRSVFRYQGLAIALSGIAAGNALAYALCTLQLKFRILSLPAEIYYMSAVPVLLRPENFVLVTAGAFCLCLLTTVIPTRFASRVDPVSALRFG